MAFTFTNLTAATNTTDGTSFATASVSPAANRLLLLGVFAASPLADATGATFTIADFDGLAWTAHGAGQEYNTASRAFRLQLFSLQTGGSAPAAGTIGITASETVEGAGWVVVQVEGTATPSVVQVVYAGGAGSATLTATLAALADAANATGGFGGIDTNNAFTPGAGYTELAGTDLGVASPSGRMAFEYAAPGSTTVDMTAAAASDWALAAFELSEAGGGGGTTYVDPVLADAATAADTLSASLEIPYDLPDDTATASDTLTVSILAPGGGGATGGHHRLSTGLGLGL